MLLKESAKKALRKKIKGIQARIEREDVFDAYMRNHPDRMEVMCARCGKRYGNHVGRHCPEGESRFEPIMETPVDNPNMAFKLRKY